VGARRHVLDLAGWTVVAAGAGNVCHLVLAGARASLTDAVLRVLARSDTRELVVVVVYALSGLRVAVDASGIPEIRRGPRKWRKLESTAVTPQSQMRRCGARGKDVVEARRHLLDRAGRAVVAAGAGRVGHLVLAGAGTSLTDAVLRVLTRTGARKIGAGVVDAFGVRHVVTRGESGKSALVACKRQISEHCDHAAETKCWLQSAGWCRRGTNLYEPAGQ
jgi:hypothetical protein